MDDVERKRGRPKSPYLKRESVGIKLTDKERYKLDIVCKYLNLSKREFLMKKVDEIYYNVIHRQI